MFAPRLLVVLTALAVVTACGDSGTLPGLSPSTGRGALIVMRRDTLAGPDARRIAIDPESGATLAPVPWFPSEVEPIRGGPFARSITFSRDGQWMAWIEVRRDTTTWNNCYDAYCWTARDSGQLYVTKVSSSTKTRLTPDFHFDRAPAFSPDGSRLVVLREHRDAEEQMITLARDGSDVRPVLLKSERRRGGPDWSPAGDFILYEHLDRRSLYLVRPDGSEPREITAGSAEYSVPSWSPDGRRIAVPLTDKHPSTDRSVGIAILGIDGAEYVRVRAVGGAWGQKMAWSPDGSRLAYCDFESGPSGHGSRTVVRVITVMNGEIRTITPAGYTDCSPIWRP